MANTPQLGEPGSTFIFPVMSQVDPDPARGLLGQTDRHDVEASCRDITRVAALSMLAEQTKHAPYGWSHCLTIPQALCHLAPYSSDTQRLLAIAATHIVGFRAAFASMPLATSFDPGPVSAGWLDALDQSTDAAAAAVWQADTPDREIVRELASRAAAQADTHLVKYTLACIDASKADPESGRLYLAAAAKLSAVWSTEID